MEEHPLEVLVTIVPRGKGELITSFLSKKGIHTNFIFFGYGTCPKEILSLFGLGEVKKEVILSLGSKKLIIEALAEMEEGVRILSVLKGISFSLNVNSVSSGKLLKLCTGMEE